MLLAAVACAEPPAHISLSVNEIASPAGIDSGEPFLASMGDTAVLSWLGRSPGGSRALLFARYADGVWGEPAVVEEREDFFVNVADLPSVTPGPDGELWAHWLQRESEGLGYGIRVTRSSDGGRTWTEPWTPHEDGTPTDHGFVSTIPADGSVGVVWLDGRAFAGVDGAAPTMETALYFRSVGADGAVGPERLVDPRVCDCCQTDAAVTAEGPVVVYRDRSEDEIRDIRLLRLEGGRWVDAGLVHEDGWETGACPINGPAVAARERHVVVAWYTAAGGQAKVLASFSDDSGRSFGRPVRLDDGAPGGRVDVLLLDDGSALVSWLERTGGGWADVRVGHVAGGRLLETTSASASFSERAMGFPRLAQVGGDTIIVAWTDGTELTPRVRVTRIDLEDS